MQHLETVYLMFQIILLLKSNKYIQMTIAFIIATELAREIS